MPYSLGSSTEVLLCEAINIRVNKEGYRMGKAQATRPRGNRIDIWATDEEMQQITENAKVLRLSRSEYLRNLGLGYQPKTQFDQDAIRDLVKLHADQGRLGGLLKLWLSEKKGEGASVQDVRSILQQIESLQMQMARLVMKQKSKS